MQFCAWARYKRGVDPLGIDLAIQRYVVTEQWKQRFRAENGDPNELDDLLPDLPSSYGKPVIAFGPFRSMLRIR
jgi:hypothetical protein